MRSSRRRTAVALALCVCLGCQGPSATPDSGEGDQKNIVVLAHWVYRAVVIVGGLGWLWWNDRQGRERFLESWGPVMVEALTLHHYAQQSDSPLLATFDRSLDDAFDGLAKDLRDWDARGFDRELLSASYREFRDRLVLLDTRQDTVGLTTDFLRIRGPSLDLDSEIGTRVVFEDVANRAWFNVSKFKSVLSSDCEEVQRQRRRIDRDLLPPALKDLVALGLVAGLHPFNRESPLPSDPSPIFTETPFPGDLSLAESVPFQVPGITEYPTRAPDIDPTRGSDLSSVQRESFWQVSGASKLRLRLAEESSDVEMEIAIDAPAQRVVMRILPSSTATLEYRQGELCAHLDKGWEYASSDPELYTASLLLLMRAWRRGTAP